MSSDQVLVQYVTQLEPAIELGPGGGPPETIAGQTRVQFSDGVELMLEATHPGAIAFAYALEFSRTEQRFLRVSFDDAKIVLVEIPLETIVNDIVDEPGKEVLANFEGYSVIFRLEKGKEDFQKLIESLNYSKDQRQPILVTSDRGRAQIVDARKIPDRSTKGKIDPEGKKNGLRGVTKLTDHQAIDLFKSVQAISCNPTSPTIECSTFLFPDFGCEARAHHMTTIFAKRKLVSGKLWAYPKPNSTLEPITRNFPPGDDCPAPCHCFVGWIYHVAPFFLSSERPGERIVFDPSLFDAPVSESDWFHRMDSPAGHTVATDQSIFFRSEDGSKTIEDPFFIRTNIMLVELRVRLCLRAFIDGSPPYRDCKHP